MKYKTGDRIREKDTGWVGTVIGVDNSGDWCHLVQYDENPEIDGDDEFYVRAEDIEFEDKRQAFLKRFKELLGDFSVKIDAIGYDTYNAIRMTIDGDELYYSHDSYEGYHSLPITADNIMNYDKD